ncbi:Rab geranylgeranyltransferase [Yamadazyma tenuis]|nr:Rab geranylgeranyltransferase [Yamadazyma tenuis]
MFHNVKREKLNQEARVAKIEKDKPKIESYLSLQSLVFEARQNHQYTVESLNKTTDLLMINPEFYTIWNIRRETLLELFAQKQLDKVKTLEDDLKMIMVLFRRFPKCYWIYNHRLWCLRCLGQSANWQVELAIVSKLLSVDQRNFHGWHLRRIVVHNYEVQTPKTPQELLSIYIKEFEFTTSKVNQNISNFSAWHNRSKLIPKIYKYYQEVDSEFIDQAEDLNKYTQVFSSRLSLLQHEIKLINTGMYVDVDDTSVWLYLYWLLSDEFFTEHLDKQVYQRTLEEQLEIIRELNELEKDDNGKDNCWCLKTMILIKCLLANVHNNNSAPSDLLTDEIKSFLEILADIDPLRKGKYLDQLHGKAELLY